MGDWEETRHWREFYTREACEQARSLISSHILDTPFWGSEEVNDRLGISLYLKGENFQFTRSFKARGAMHAVLKMEVEDRARGVVTHSSGNFAQAVARAAHILNIPATIVMPENAPGVKVEGVKRYRANIVFCGSTIEQREEVSERVKMSTGAAFLHPSNDVEVILGQSTVASEMLERRPDLDLILTPVGGGGLLAGTALASHYFGGEGVRVWGAEPTAADDAYRSLKLGRRVENASVRTMADGLRTHLGDKNFPVIRSLVDRVVCVEEDEIIKAMKWVAIHFNIIIEPSSAVAIAAVLKCHRELSGKRVGVVVSGGNVEWSQWVSWVR